MSKYTDRLNNISTGRFTGIADYDRQPSGLLQAMSEKHYAKTIASGLEKDGNVSDALLREVSKDNNQTLDIAMIKRANQTYS